MGALHAGHRALLRRAVSWPGRTGASWPRSSSTRCSSAPPRISTATRGRSTPTWRSARRRASRPSSHRTGERCTRAATRVTVDPGPTGQVLEGEFRPGFFGGVLTVVLKLFQVTRPDIAVFGRKDAQQLALVRQMVADLDLGVRIEAVDTVRDADCLATSSRNAYLSAGDRAAALAIPAALAAGRDAAAAARDRCCRRRAGRSASGERRAGAAGGLPRPGASRDVRPGQRAVLGPGGAGGRRPGRDHPPDRRRPAHPARGGPRPVLAINIRNTDAVLGIFDGGEVVEDWRIATVLTAPRRDRHRSAGPARPEHAGQDADVSGVALCFAVPFFCRSARCGRCAAATTATCPALDVEPGVRPGVPVRMNNPEIGSRRS